MAGFKRSNLTDIKFLRNLFNESTDHFLVLKELIQNADDSGTDGQGTASFVALGCSQGLPDADHPLLSAPAIFAVNDGTLSRSDAEAIVSLGLSTKGGDSSTVGKFGLGLKSVFYLAEALFFMDARHSPEERWASPHFDVLSPWLSGDAPIHPEWLQFTAADRVRILTHLKGLGIPEGFVVWVPLRRRSDCLVPGHELPVQVMSNYFGDQPFAISDQTIQDVQDLMPMLGRVRRIIVKARPEIGAPLLVLDQVGAQRTSDFRDPTPFQRTFAGAVTSSSTVPTMYVGHEALVAHDWLTNLNRSEHWPSTEVVTLYGNDQKKDPSVPHGAAVWQRSEGQGSRLRALWSVFLPVEEALNEALNTSATYTLTLHGYFFLKEDRKAIYDLELPLDGQAPANVSELRRYWNGLLALQTTLPVVLQGLAEITSGADEAERTEVSRALRKSDFARTHLDALTRQHQWARQLEGPTFQWKLTPAEQTFLPVHDHSALLNLWPNLHDLAGEHGLLDASSPNFVSRLRSAPVWPLDLARRLVAQLDFPALLGRPDRMLALRHMLRFLPLSELRSDVLQAVRTAWPESEAPLLSKHRSEVAALLAELFPEQLLALPEAFPPSLAERLRAAACSVLIVPFGYAPASKERLLTERDAQLLLDAIQNEDDIVPVLRLTNDRLPESADLPTIYGDRKLLPTSRGSQGQGPWLTLKEAADLASQNLIFRQQGDDAVLLGHLQDVLGEAQLYLVPSRVVDLLELEIPRLSAAAVLNTVQQAQTAAPARFRLALIQKLIESAPSVLDRTEHRPVLRSLLHGNPAHAADVTTPLLIGEGSGHLWGKVARLAAESSPLGWSVIREPVEFLTPRAKRLLSVEVASPESLGPLLDSAPHTFSGAKLTPDEREAFILEWKDDALLKTLPLFKTVKGPLTAITPGVHLDGGMTVTESLKGKVTLLARPESELLKRRLGTLAPALTASDVWGYLRNEPEVWRHWPTLLDALRNLSTAVIPQRANELPWWPLSSGGGVAPKDVLFFPRVSGTKEEIQKLREAGTTTPEHRQVIEADLVPEFLQAAGVSILRLLRSEEGQIEQLCGLVSQTPLYHVGNTAGRAKVWLTAFSSMDAGRLPLVGLLQAFASHEDFQAQLLKAGSRPPTPARLGEQLAYLYGQITGAPDPDMRTAASSAYLALLADVRDHGRPLTLLSKLHLLNGAGEWKKADDLTVAGSQYDPRYVLHEDHRKALYGDRLTGGGELPAGPAPVMAVPLEIALKNGGQSLRAFVRECEKADIAREQLGAFLGLLDGNPDFHKVAGGYLANFDFGVFREQALRDVPRDKLPSGFSSYKDLLDLTRLLITVNKGHTQQVANLLGDPLEVPFQGDGELTSLFSHHHGMKPFRHGDLFVYPVELKWVDLQRSDLNLSELLLHSVRWVLSMYHSFLPPHVAAEYFKVVSSSQATVKATQSRLIKAASQTWGRQLGLGRDSRVRLLLSVIDQADRAAEQAREQGAPAREREALTQVHEHQVRLRKLVEDDADTQKTLLSGVQKKVQDQQYVPASVPFELLQNADDALIEWQEMTREVDERRQTFTLSLQNRVLRIVHHGRPVNFYSYGDFDGRSRSFDADLEKMLTLLSSDKGAGVTGQFGLGFKSVFLLSDRPTVKSGRLAFTVLGGVYPVVPTETEVTALRQFTDSVSPPELPDGTLIELPLRDVPLAKAVVQRFKDLAPYTLAFTRAIRTLQLHTEEGKVHWTWHTQQVRPGVEFVRAQPSGTGDKALTALALRTGQVDLLLPLEGAGFGALPPSMPNLWVTAPTGEILKLPFLVNAGFPLDPGRAQLARNEAQVSAFVQRLVPDLREAFVQLFLTAKEGQWNQVNGWTPPNTREFLRGLWKVLGESIARAAPTPALDAIKALLWGTTGAYGALTLEQQLVPSLLPQTHNTLVRAGDPALCVLNVELKVAAVLLKQPGFRKRYPPGALISEETARTLGALDLPVPQKQVNLVEALSLLLPEQQVSPEAAIWLTTVLGDDQLRNLREEKATDQWLGGLSFLAQDRCYHRPAELLVGGAKVDSDESARFPFAPDSARLSEDYPAETLVLFRRLRGDAPKLSTVTWLLQATADKQVAALKYLSALGPKDPVAVELRQRLGGTWLLHDRLVSSAAWNSFSEEEQIDVLNVLRQARQVLAPVEVTSLVTPIDDEDDDDLFNLPPLPTDAVRRLAEWWTREGAAHATRYNTRLYPGGVPLVTSSDVDLDMAHDRRAWFSLLLLSSLQTMGRVKPESHRGFLELLKGKAWLSTYSNPATGDDAWLGTVRDFLTSNPEVLKFAHWMRGFVGFYQLGHWLPQYVELILNFEHMPPTSLRTLLAPDVNPALSGSGLSAPPLGQTLGIGGPFLIRELLRAGVLTNPALHPLAYVPTGRIRRLFEELTQVSLPKEQPEQNSRAIHAYLVRELGTQGATFGGHFDLPLQALAGTGRDDDEALALQHRLFGRTLIGGLA